ncbi:hypothetical protein GF340_04200 [Candidatus Peregrinibacteria bacterium]|nr:hypothetical protein [Candidatus Peregrinibacteria bacterium]
MKKVHKKIIDYRLTFYRLLAKLQKKDIVHFLHIGKTGGSSIKYALHDKKKVLTNHKFIILCHAHNFTLTDTMVGEKLFFVVRDPVDRFISGFYSRKRQGLPRICVEWSDSEKEAFEAFATPNELALALSSKDPTTKEKAEKAMRSIGHVRSSYWDWFKSEELLLSRKSDILFIGNQVKLDEDFARLKKILNLPTDLDLPKDPVKAHKNPYHYDKHLDNQARDILKDWYYKDYAFLQLLEKNDLL